MSLLDAETCATIGRLAKLWNQPEIEVIRRVVKEAEPAHTADDGIQKRLKAWHDLQASLAARGVDIEEWKRVARDSRR